MKNLLQRVLNETPATFDYEWLGEFVKSIDPNGLDYKDSLPVLPSDESYSRNILCLEPFEVVLLHWPVGVESAVHLHRGFWGYVLCLEGQIDNVVYLEQGNKMVDGVSSRATRGGIVPEPEGTVHKILNSGKEALVTLHFYAPALETLDGLVLYDLETGTKGTLNNKAQTASFIEPKEHFITLEEDAFTYLPSSSGSHRLFPILPKPNSDTIRCLVSAYYEEQAIGYDSFDLHHPNRSAYTSSINGLIAESLQASSSIENVLDLACGTGRRAIDIRNAAGLHYKLHGVDLSPDMAEIARNRGIEPYVGPWTQMDMGAAAFDAVTFLYAYGHIPSVEERKASLLKIHDCLKPGGQLFLDVFNADDPDEWGPKAYRYYTENNLESQGYEPGDVFYRKSGGTEVAFLHYCNLESMTALLLSSGFTIEHVYRIGYNQNAGQRVETGGKLFFHVSKP